MKVAQDKHTESELVHLLKQRDKAVFSELYDRYSGALYGVVLRILNRDEENAQDVLQDAFVKIWKNMDAYDAAKGSLFTWMLNIARNAAIDKVRSLGRHAIQSLNENVIEKEGNVQTTKIDQIGLKEVIERLKPEHRQLIELAYFGGYTQEEISDHLSLPLGTVKTRTRAALQELRKIVN